MNSNVTQLEPIDMGCESPWWPSIIDMLCSTTLSSASWSVSESRIFDVIQSANKAVTQPTLSTQPALLGSRSASSSSNSQKTLLLSEIRTWGMHIAQNPPVSINGRSIVEGFTHQPPTPPFRPTKKSIFLTPFIILIINQN